MIFLKIFYGILLFSAGIVTIKYRKTIYEWTGRFAWAERHLGSGGTVIVITLTGMFLIFLSIAYPAGVFERDPSEEGGNRLRGWDKYEDVQENRETK